MKFYGLALSLGTLLALGSSLQASTVFNYSFGGLGNLGSSTHTFAPVGGSGPTIAATGYRISGFDLASANLYSKGSAAFPLANDESGLGLTNDPSGDHEITPGSFIMLDLGNVDKYKLASLDIYTESTTGGEQWVIAGSNKTPFNATSLAQFDWLSGNTEGLQDADKLKGDRYIYVGSACGNILLGGMSVATVTPEPASAGLMGLALAGAGLLFRRRFSK